MGSCRFRFRLLFLDFTATDRSHFCREQLLHSVIIRTAQEMVACITIPLEVAENHHLLGDVLLMHQSS